VRRLVAVVLLTPAIAYADDPCENPVVDPVVTPVRDVYLDAQRNACLRNEVSAGLSSHALIDTPGFHGVLGGDLALGGRIVVRNVNELSAQIRLVDFAFVQNAVNKVTNTGVGPIVLGAAAGTPIGEGARAALVARLELPYTRDQMDTTRTSGELAGVLTGRLAGAFTLDARLGVLGMVASSVAGDTSRLAFRAGADIAWIARPHVAFQAGADLMAGWTHGFDHLLLRAGVHWAVHGGPWRLRAGAGMPVGGSERTNAIVDLTLVHDL
jgi:hypothetical protein